MVTLSEAGKRTAEVTWRHRCEAAAAIAFFGLCRVLPLDAASGLAGWLARRIGPLVGVSRRARRNLAAALPELSAAQIEEIVRGMWDNIGRVAAEYPHLDRVKVFEKGGRVEVGGIEHVDRALAEGRRMILFAGHLANWELGPLAAAQYGLRTTNIYRSANNPLIDRMIQQQRALIGEYVPKEEAGRRALAALRRGSHLGILVDQKLNEGIPVPFFGRAAMTAPTLAVLALRFDCAVLPVHVERLRGAHFRLTVEPALALPNTGDRTADIAALMTAVNAILERWIRARPEQWFWVHRRWPDDG